MSYSYFGLLYGKFKVSLALLSVVTSGHAAVWLGTEAPTTSRWVQAGIADVNGERFDYIEIRTPTDYSLVQYPASARTHVRIVTRHGRWRVFIDGHSSRWVWVPHAQPLACLEMYGPGHASARIAGRPVSG